LPARIRPAGQIADETLDRYRSIPCGDRERSVPMRSFSGDDRWLGHMPPSVAFALITSKLLWHVCAADGRDGLTALGGIPKDSVTRARKRTELPWTSLCDLPDEHLVDLHTWLCLHDDWQVGDLRRVYNAILIEADLRGWPEGWW